MKKNALTNAVIAGIAGVAGLAGVANAVNLNPDGLGQVLIYPYYTVNGGNSTLVSVVNTTEFGKAVKVRFLEGYNSREVLDFNLYLSPYDVWTGAVFALNGSATGPGNLTTADTSCTAPNIRTNASLPQLPNGARYVPFRNYQYVTTTLVNNTGSNDSGPDHLERTREGHLEIIEMGIVLNAANGGAENSLNAITHNASGLPNNCLKVQLAWTPGSSDPYWIESDGLYDVVAPDATNRGGLFGSAAIVDAANGTQLTYAPDAIDGFSVVNLHTEPGTTEPTLADATYPDALTANAIVFDNGNLQTLSYDPNAQGIDAVSAVFMHDAIFNEYAVATDSAGTQILASEWVVTFPTKRFYVDQLLVGTVPVAPFQYIFPTSTSHSNAGRAPVDITLGLYNREEASPTDPQCDDPNDPSCLDFSPTLPGADPVGPQLNWESQVITFNQPDNFNAAGQVTGASSILGSKLIANIDTSQYGFTTGWLRMGFYAATSPFAGSQIDEHISRADELGQTLVGMPVTGFWAENTQTTSVLANFAGLWKHKGSRCLVPSGISAASQCGE